MKKSLNSRVSKRSIIVGICILGIILTGVIVLVVFMSKKDQSTINSFQQCADAGYPIQESFPERCAVPGGKTFTNIR